MFETSPTPFGDCRSCSRVALVAPVKETEMVVLGPVLEEDVVGPKVLMWGAVVAGPEMVTVKVALGVAVVVVVHEKERVTKAVVAAVVAGQATAEPVTLIANFDLRRDVTTTTDPTQLATTGQGLGLGEVVAVQVAVGPTRKTTVRGAGRERGARRGVAVRWWMAVAVAEKWARIRVSTWGPGGRCYCCC